MRSILLFIFTLLCVYPMPAQTADNSEDRPFVGHFYCKETGVHMFLDLYEASLEAPGFSFLGKMNGFMYGDIYGTWMITEHKITERKATLRFSNDIGSDTQTILFIQEGDSIFSYKAQGTNSIRKAEGRKLVKIASEMQFVKQP